MGVAAFDRDLDQAGIKLRFREGTIDTFFCNPITQRREASRAWRAGITQTDGAGCFQTKPIFKILIGIVKGDEPLRLHPRDFFCDLVFQSLKIRVCSACVLLISASILRICL